MSKRISARFFEITILVSLSLIILTSVASCDKENNDDTMQLALLFFASQQNGNSRDTEEPGVSITENTTTLSENGGQGSYSIVLDSAPDGDVVIDVESKDTGEVKVSADDGGTTAESVSLTFTIDNWSTAQTVTLVGEDDSDKDGEQSVVITNTMNTSSTTDTTGYATIDPDDVTVTVTSDETAWAMEAYIKAPNGESDDQFGESVSLYEDTLAVGAIGEDSNQTTITNGSTASADNSFNTSGAVYVFTRNGSTWSQQAYIKAPNAEDSDQFGISVSLYGNTLAVGTILESSNQTTITNGTTASLNNSASYAGAIYVFTRSGSTWSQEAYIKAPNAQSLDYFGRSVSLYENTLAVGANGEDSNQTTITNGGIPSVDDSANESGAVYVFIRSGSTWSSQAYIKAPNAELGDYFGYSSSLFEDTLAVGAYNENSSQTTITNGSTASADNSASNSGAVYVFTRTGGH